MRTRLQITLEENLYNQLKSISVSTSIPMSKLLDKALEMYLPTVTDKVDGLNVKEDIEKAKAQKNKAKEMLGID